MPPALHESPARLDNWIGFLGGYRSELVLISGHCIEESLKRVFNQLCRAEESPLPFALPPSMKIGERVEVEHQILGSLGTKLRPYILTKDPVPQLNLQF